MHDSASELIQTAATGNHMVPGHGPAMPFGKHKGTPLEELPNEYLLWLGCLDDLRQPLLGHVLREMGRRLVVMDQKTATADKGAR